MRNRGKDRERAVALTAPLCWIEFAGIELIVLLCPLPSLRPLRGDREEKGEIPVWRNLRFDEGIERTLIMVERTTMIDDRDIDFDERTSLYLAVYN